MPIREYIFKAKRKDNGEWVEGNLLTYGDGDCSICVAELELFMRQYLVDPETVCEYTGMTDKNGTRIFEGDIVKNRGRYDEHIGIVLYQNTRFRVRWVRHIKLSSKGVSARTIDLSTADESLGNIYDNPELLEVNKND